MVMLAGVLLTGHRFFGAVSPRSESQSKFFESPKPTVSPVSQLQAEQPLGNMEVKNTSSELQDIPFIRLRVEEAERQAGGDVREEDAIPAQERVFTDLECWHSFWAKYDLDKVPKVDFRTRLVAAVFLGAKPSPGYGVEISKITYDPQKKRTIIHIVELLPDPELAYAGVIVYPADIVIFPAKSGKVQFARTKKLRTE